MSVESLTDEEENVYNIPKIRMQTKSKETTSQMQFEMIPRRPRRKFKVLTKEHATMGVPETDLPDPQNYLKKHTGKPCYVIRDKTKKEIKSRRKGPTPKLADCLKAEKPVRPRKNFICENVKTICTMKPKEPIPTVVIDRYGTKKPLKAGLEPIYIKIPPFGKTPKYLKRFIDIKEKEYQMKKDVSVVERPLCTYITRDQREVLLKGLKQNWEELQQQYLKLPILTDTLPKIMRKAKMEATLKQLEKDIVLLERHPYIYVYEDNETMQELIK